MLPNDVINHMDMDELRNYLGHVQRVEEAHGDWMHAQGEMIDLLQRLYNAQNYKEEQRIRHDAALFRLRQTERNLEQEYEEYMPRPVCGDKEERK